MSVEDGFSNSPSILSRIVQAPFWLRLAQQYKSVHFLFLGRAKGRDGGDKNVTVDAVERQRDLFPVLTLLSI